MTTPAGDGAEGTPTGPEVDADAGEITPPAANDWWQFTSKEDAEAWGNKLVTTRLTRERKTKLDPIVQERDTLKAEVERLKPLEDATKTDAERWEAEKASFSEELTSLREFKTQTERGNQLREIAEEEGLDPKFLKFVNTNGDEDSVREGIKDLLNVLSEGGSTPGKKTPTPKAPKPSGEPNGGQLQPGGGGNDGEDDESLSVSILDQIRADRKSGGLTTRR